MTAISSSETLNPPAAPPSIPVRSAKLSLGFKMTYGGGQVLESIVQALINTFFLFYMTNVCGLSGSLTGLAMFLALAVDSVADPVIGSFSDNLVSRWGRRVPVMALSLLPVALALALLFSIPHLKSGWPLFSYVLALLILLRVAGSGFVIPYLGLGAELSDDYDERSSVVAFRAIFGMIGTLVGLVLGLGIFLTGPKGLLERAGYAPLGYASAAVLLIAGVLATLASTRFAHRIEPPLRVRTPLFRRLFGEAREVFRNPSFRMLFGGVMMFFIGQGVALTLALDANKYFWALSASQIQAVTIAQVGGLALGLPLAFLLIGRVEKRTVVVVGITVICLTQSLAVIAELLGIFPTNASVRVPLLVCSTVLANTALTMIAISFQSAMADSVDEHEYLFSTRREGLYFASLSFAAKAATGLGSLICGLLLDVIHFPSEQIAAGADVTIAPQILRNLGLGAGLAAALITVISVLFFSRYKLNRKALAAIHHKLGR